MNALITFLTLMLLVLVGMTQNGSIPSMPGYIASGIVAALILVLAVVRYRSRKAAGD
jgi:hypothetical protein